MKILYLIPRFTAGGAEQLVWQYAQYFQDKGHEVLVVSTVGGGEWEQKFKDVGIKIFVNEKSSFFNWCKNYKKVKAIKKSFQPDIIHTHVFSADLFGYFLRQNVKWISTQHNVGRESSWLRLQVLKCILRKSNQVIAVSSGVEKFCLEDLKLKNNQVTKILNGIEVGKWLNIKNNNLFTDSKMRLGIIGRLEEQKGHKYLFQALAGLSFPWVLNIYGEGSKKEFLQKLAQDLNIQDKIIWQGVKDSYLEMNNIDVIVQPSLWEGLSLVIMEAMAGGKVVVASKVAGEDLIEDGKSGFIVPTGDIVVLTEKINYIWENKEASKKIANAAREKAKELDLNINIKKVEETYRNDK